MPNNPRAMQSQPGQRRLLPAAAALKSPEPSPLLTESRPSPLEASGPLPKRRSAVPTACSNCRKTKTKCSGGRPVCRRCAQQNYLCEYGTQPGETQSRALKRSFTDLQSRAMAQTKILELLSSLPELQAQDILRRIRSGADMVTICNQVMAGDVLTQLAVVPETRFRYNLPHMPEMPQEYASPDNLYLYSLIYESASLYSPASNIDAAAPTTEANDTDFESPYLRPFHAAHVIDPLLSDAKPSLWTGVCQDDMLMRDLLSVWLQCEYSFTAAFQKDYFLEDMASKSRDFCSSLLVNAVLAYCCVCYSKFTNRAEYWNPQTLGYRFLAEAKRIWELEATEPRLTTVQAGIILNVFHNLCGLDEIGQAYRIQSIALAHQLHLFENPANGDSERTRNGNLFTAWALYQWESLVGFSFQQLPLLTEAPKEPLPDPGSKAQWYGEVWMKYPLSQHVYPSRFSYLFKAKAGLRIIMQKFCTLAYANDVKVPPEEAYSLLSQLKSWSASLPVPLQAKNIVLPAQIQLHVYLQHLTLAIFEPLLDTNVEQQPSPQEIVTEATRNLQTLIRLYYIRHGFEAMDLFIVIPLIYAGVKCLENINDQISEADLKLMRSTLLLVANGLDKQRRNHYLSEALYKVVRGRMRPQEVALLKETLDLDDEEEEKQSLRQAVRSQWPVSVVKRKEDLDSHVLMKMVGDMNLKEEPRGDSDSQ